MATFETITAAAIGGGGGGSSYLVYTAVLTQDGTDAPVATVLENTLGVSLTIGRTNVGVYTIGNGSAPFTSNKTFPFPYGIAAIPLSQNANGYMQTTINSDSEITIYIYDDLVAFNPVELSTITGGTGGVLFEIRVYPS